MHLTTRVEKEKSKGSVKSKDMKVNMKVNMGKTKLMYNNDTSKSGMLNVNIRYPKSMLCSVFGNGAEAASLLCS